MTLRKHVKSKVVGDRIRWTGHVQRLNEERLSERVGNRLVEMECHERRHWEDGCEQTNKIIAVDRKRCQQGQSRRIEPGDMNPTFH